MGQSGSGRHMLQSSSKGGAPRRMCSIAALPTIFVYLALGKFFMQGLLAGSVKG